MFNNIVHWVENDTIYYLIDEYILRIQKMMTFNSKSNSMLSIFHGNV